MKYLCTSPVLLSLYGAALLTTTSCVSQKKYTALQAQYTEVSKAREQLQVEKSALQKEKNRSEEALRTSLLSKNQQVNQLNASLSGAQQENTQLSADLRGKEQRIAEMQRILDQKDAAVKALRQKVGDALLGFNAQDLQVNVRNGKVYVSLSEQLLFKSGSTKVDPKGQEALSKLAAALKGNQDVNVLVEGHTDTVPIAKGTPGMRDNWDLSVLRATEITRILTQAGLPAAQVTPSGRAQYVPVSQNDTPANKALNRRTEIILTPKLDELFQILEQN
ncbi:chemotaxis protein MotB [Hymenobacter luteus]|uniref:Chemotaxis protein MotB n=2 Tax=Hymenobacter TaxID=89966 RepID=A0A7W9T267_9BACT|nr:MULTISPECIES: OmpA family protein [Hymenobacter]MBB4602142.1 chemotaxis protein MotB [Hymenobacter latericoloratus]MBB6059429.1 chemotaxis protein MotB [Hymenobacter luteus]